MNLMDELKSYSIDNDVNFSVTREVSSLFKKNNSPSFDEVKLLVNKLIADTWSQFATETGKKDIRTRINKGTFYTFK